MTLKPWMILAVMIVLFQSIAKADTVYTTVFNVFESLKTERLLVLSASDGRVFKATRTEESIKRIKALVGKVVRLDFRDLGREAVITSIREVLPGEVDTTTLDLNHFRYNQLRQFAPTDLQGYDDAKKIFDDMLNDGDKSRSECFKRAHMWSFDMWSKLGVSSEKIFIFYTQRYQILEEEKWWFHVAPMVTAGGVEYVLDGTFLERPVTIKNWLTHFIKTDKITCPEISRYQQFEEGHWTRLCYYMRVPMHYFSPLNIENRDKNGVERNHWVLEELQDSRKAFKNWEQMYEGLDTGKIIRKF